MSTPAKKTTTTKQPAKTKPAAVKGNTATKKKPAPKSAPKTAVKSVKKTLEQAEQTGQTDKVEKNPVTTPSAENAPVSDNPFRKGSYSLVYDVLAKHPEGITRAKLLEELKAVSTKTDKLLNYDISVVVSSRQTGEAHKSISRKADLYYVEKGEGGFLKLHMRS